MSGSKWAWLHLHETHTHTQGEGSPETRCHSGFLYGVGGRFGLISNLFLFIFLLLCIDLFSERVLLCVITLKPSKYVAGDKEMLDRARSIWFLLEIRGTLVMKLESKSGSDSKGTLQFEFIASVK